MKIQIHKVEELRLEDVTEEINKFISIKRFSEEDIVNIQVQQGKTSEGRSTYVGFVIYKDKSIEYKAKVATEIWP